MIKVTNRDLIHELSEPNHLLKTSSLIGFSWCWGPALVESRGSLQMSIVSEEKKASESSLG